MHVMQISVTGNMTKRITIPGKCFLTVQYSDTVASKCGRIFPDMNCSRSRFSLDVLYFMLLPLMSLVFLVHFAALSHVVCGYQARHLLLFPISVLCLVCTMTLTCWWLGSSAQSLQLQTRTDQPPHITPAL
jgi:hypothetical protein